MADFLTNMGRDIVTNRIIGSGTEPKYIGWGTGGTAASAASVSLSGEVTANLSTTTGTRPAGTSSRVTTNFTNDTYQVTGTLTASGGTGSVTNAGLFDAAGFTTGVGGNLYVIGSFTPIALASGDSIAFTFKHTLT